MYLQLTLQELSAYTSRAVEAGISAYKASLRPADEMVKQSEAKRFIAQKGLRPAMLKKWVDAGLITPRKTGEKQNATVLYSLSEIENLLASCNLKNLCNEQGVRYEEIKRNILKRYAQ